MALASSEEVVVADVVGEEVVCRLESTAGEAWKQSVCLFDGGRKLAVVTELERVFVFDLDAPQDEPVVVDLDKPVDRVEASPSGELFAVVQRISGRSNSVFVVEAATGEVHAELKGARTTIGVEVVHIGYARRGVPAGPDWLTVDDPTGRTMRVAPWPVEQLTMCVAVGREIVRRFPAIGPRDHHGHDDLCPGFKQDPSHAFPYARLLRAIYRDPSLPDVWSPLRTRAARRRVLRRLGHGLPWPADEDVARPWGPDDVDALERFQTTAGLTVDGCWTSFVSWRVHDVLGEDGLAAAVRPPARVVRRPAPDRSSPARPTRSADAPSPPAPD
ncbi:MAG: hypothetical protein AAF772_18440 [Acidobacteriota bacterium]